MPRSDVALATLGDAMPDEHRDDGYDPDRWDARFIEARDGPRELEEGEYRRTLASLNSGWLARGGLLRLHDDRLSFVPTPMERLLFARTHVIRFSDIDDVRREPERVGDVLPGGKAPRMRISMQSRSYEFVFVHGLDDWLDAVDERRRIWENRTRITDGN
jgi:hypothetical protein